jgi:hypothetical protein
MRTITAVALALSMLIGVTAAQATTSTTHKKHHSKKHTSSQKKGGDKGSKDQAPAK